MKNSKALTETITGLVSPAALEIGVTIWDVEFARENGEDILRVTIDREGGIDSNTCYRFTELTNPILDAADPIPESYIYEVSSPGLGRKLKKPAHFAFAEGREVVVRLIRPQNGERDFVGTLDGVRDKIVTITDSTGAKSGFEIKDTAYIKLHDDDFDF